MRFMLLVKADRNTEAGALPDAQPLAEMGKHEAEDFGPALTPELADAEARMRAPTAARQAGQRRHDG